MSKDSSNPRLASILEGVNQFRSVASGIQSPAATSTPKSTREDAPTPSSSTTSTVIPSTSADRTASNIVATPRPIGRSQLIVNTRQKGNPVLNYIRGVPWEYEGKIKPDFVMGASSCALYLSMDYHLLHPEYISGRISKLGKDFELRVLFVKIKDTNKDIEHLKELTNMAVYTNFTLIVCWSDIEVASYLSNFKAMEKSSRKIIQGQPKQDYNACLIEAVGKIRGINKNDAISVVTNYGSLKRAILDDGNNLESISGWGETKVKRFKAAINEPFIYNKKYPTKQSPSSEHHSTVSTPAGESNIS